MPTQPGQIGNIVPVRNDPGALMRMIRQMQQDIQALQGALVVNGITVNGLPGIVVEQGGGLTLVTPTAVTVLNAGTTTIPDGSGRTQQVFEVFRDDGTPALILSDLGTVPGHTHQQAMIWQDRSDNSVFADDTVSGVGIARPYIPVGMFVDITPPTATTTSTSFVAMQWADCFQQHPKVTVSVLVETPSGTTGEVRLTVGGVQLGATLTIPSNSFGQFTIIAAAWPSGTYTFGQRVTTQLEARTTAGAGAIGVRCLGAWGVQT